MLLRVLNALNYDGALAEDQSDIHGADAPPARCHSARGRELRIRAEAGRLPSIEQYRISRVEEEFFESEGIFEFVVSDSTSIALKVESVFEVHIHAAKPVRKEMVERFTNAELRLILLPYARHFVSTITAQMQIPPVVLPLAINATNP